MSDIYKPGDLVYSGLPFACVLYKEVQGLICDYCLKRGKDLKKCTACKYVFYCSKTCQKKAWNEHVNECRCLKNLRKDYEDYIRLLAKVVFKVKGKNWENIKENVTINHSRSFGDLISHTEKMKKDPRLRLYLLEIVFLLETFIGKENLPQEDKLYEIIGKVKYNRFQIYDDVSPKATALYIGGSIFDHSCIPNAQRIFNEKQMEIRAILPITQKEVTKVTISYIPTLQNFELYDFKEHFFGPCKCIDCSLPYGESTLTKIIDTSKASSVIECTEKSLKNMKDLLFGAFKPRITPFEKTMISKEMQMLIKKQKNILGETNILHLRLLCFMAMFANNPDEEQNILYDLANKIKMVFGENCHELLWIYQKLGQLCLMNGDIEGHNHYLEQIIRIEKVHHGAAYIPKSIADVFMRAINIRSFAF